MPVNNGSVDQTFTVTVRALDVYGNFNPVENRVVRLVCSGSLTGCGVVPIAAGSGSLQVADRVPESITLSLANDTNPSNVQLVSNQQFIIVPGMCILPWAITTDFECICGRMIAPTKCQQ